MLDADPGDAETVRQWLRAALANADAGRKAALAAHCGVTPQAVSGWLKTGRVRKLNLARAAQFFGHGPTFGGAARPPMAGEPAPVYAAQAVPWPFSRINHARIARLPPLDLATLEGAWILAARQLGLHVDDGG
jgi:hypothetical protein